MINSLPYLILLAFLVYGIYLLDRHQQAVDARSDRGSDVLDDIDESDSLQDDKALEEDVKNQGYAFRSFLGIGVNVETWGGVSLPLTLLTFDKEEKAYDTVYEGICSNGNYRITIDRLKARTDDYLEYLIENKIITDNTDAQVLD